jgi:hypothetical protein
MQINKFIKQILLKSAYFRLAVRSTPRCRRENVNQSMS